jgi:hypothetical protein
MQVTKATEKNDTKQHDNDRQQTQLNNRYGKIGISAVAAAVRCKDDRKTVSHYRIPYDRD